MVSNQLLPILTQVCIGICHKLSQFLELSFSEGVKQFLGLLNQPPTPLITLLSAPIYPGAAMFVKCRSLMEYESKVRWNLAVVV